MGINVYLAAFIECKTVNFFYLILIDLLIWQSKSREGRGKERVQRLLSVPRNRLPDFDNVCKWRFHAGASVHQGKP